MIVEVASGESYADYIENHIFEPLGMADTMYCDPVAIVPHRARGYSVKDGEVVNADPLSLNPPGAAGAMCSTPLDLLRWQRALDTNSLISAESRAIMLTEATLNDGSGTKYAYGLSLGDLDGHLNVAHGGGINGFLVALDTFPDDGLVVVVLSNTDGAKSGRIADNIARTVLGIPIPEFEDLPLPEGWQEVFTGTFTAMGEELRLFADGDKLMVEGPVGSSRLMHQGMGEFVLEANTDMGFKFVGTGGDQMDLVLVAGGMEIKTERK
jgi:CubicO group peptidase (beta-lactamase class C family)